MKMMRSLLSLTLFVLFCCMAWAGVSVAATISISSPGSVANGEAFVARISSASSFDVARFGWKQKQYAVPAIKVQEGGAPRWVASILLPVSLDEKPGKLTLTGRVNDAAVKSVSRTIQVTSKKRPVQNLKVENKYVEPPKEVLDRIKRDRAAVKVVLGKYTSTSHWRLPLVKPVPGSVSSLFGVKRVFNGKPRSEHKGLDLRGATGQPIKAMAGGIVRLSDSLYYGGNSVYIDHGLGFVSAYMHMSSIGVKDGQRVSAGEVIGKVGATGRVTGPHLHLSTYAQGVAVDPEALLSLASGK